MPEPVKLGELILADGIYKSGIVYDLKKESQVLFDKTYSRVLSDWHIEVNDKSQVVIAKSKEVLSRNDILEQSYPLVQEFLDMMLIESRILNAVKSIETYVMWFEEGGDAVLEITTTDYMQIKSGTQVRVTHTDPSTGVRTEEIIRTPVTTYNASFRYYRLAQLSDDVIESFRSLYIAFENMLDTIESFRQGDGEWTWTKRGLQEIVNKAELARILGCQQQDVATTFESDVYNVRHKLFHSKFLKGYILPLDVTERVSVVKAFELLDDIYRLLVNQFLGATLPRGGVVNQGLNALAANMHNKTKKFQIILSDNEAEIKEDDTLEQELKAKHLFLDATSVLDKNVVSVGAEFKPNSIHPELPGFIRCASVMDSTGMQIRGFEKPLFLSDIVTKVRFNFHTHIQSADFTKHFKS